MKILYHHRIRSKDGQYVHVEELTHALRELGHDLSMVEPAAMAEESFGSESSSVAWLKRRIPQAIYELLEFGYCLYDFARLVARILSYKPDVIYERFNLYLPSGVWASKLFGLPLLLEINAPIFEERSRYDGIGLPRIARWTQTYAWRGATKCLPVTQALARYVTDAGVPEQDVVVIPNGINEATFGAPASRARSEQLIPESMRGTLVLGFVGFVRSWHGMDGIVSLIADPEFAGQRISLLVVGDGPARPDLERQARASNVADRVLFTGSVARDRIKPYLEVFDIALQPKVVSYASPLKLFEYLAMGCAIVAPATPNIEEVLRDGDNALLFDPDSPDSMRSAIVRLARDAALRERLGARAKSTIVEGGYTWRHNAERVTQLFEAARRD